MPPWFTVGSGAIVQCTPEHLLGYSVVKTNDMTCPKKLTAMNMRFDVDCISLFDDHICGVYPLHPINLKQHW